MTIRRGEMWGEPVERAADLRVAHSDAELAAMLRVDRVTPITVRGGDVFCSLGSPPERDDMQRLQLDLLHVSLDEEPATIAVAHVTARRSWWFGPLVGVFNVSHLGDWNAAPRAHLNDGRFDTVTVEASLGLRARWQAAQRIGAGTHVPHPEIATARVTEFARSFDRPVDVRLDGSSPVRARRVRVDIEPDAFHLDI